MNKFEQISFYPADILLPYDVNMGKWSVVACDQYTSQPEYWRNVEEYVADSPSAYNLILPEIYLNCSDVSERIESINKNMDIYFKSVLREYKNCYIYVERTLKNGTVRKGIVGAVDLEQYEFEPGNNAVIRATEGTVAERIPPRVKVRENASLELPHVMLLIDDEKNTVFGSLGENLGSVVYDFELMADSGHLKGYVIKDNERLADAFLKFKNENEKKNGSFLFAVGDGNHSLATAKACWEKLKKNGADAENHPSRYALTEVVNIHDSGLLFEPIHRIVYGCEPEKLVDELIKCCGCSHNKGEKSREISVVLNCKAEKLYINKPTSNLAVGTLQNFLDKYISENGGEVDYIHGEDVVKQLSEKENTVGFLLPKIEKSSLFETIISDGILPRKTFSMGEAYDKRFYTEARRIIAGR